MNPSAPSTPALPPCAVPAARSAYMWAPHTLTLVQRQLESLVLELFGTVKVNSISRQDRNQKGFRSVGWKSDGPIEHTAPPVQETLL